MFYSVSSVYTWTRVSWLRRRASLRLSCWYSPPKEHVDPAFLATFDLKIDLHRRKCTVLDDLFTALLRKPITGEIRVADLDLSKLRGAEDNIDTDEVFL